MSKFSKFATPEKLEPFKKLNFSGTTLPEMFMRFCHHAKKGPPNDRLEDHDDNLFTIHQENSTAVLWKTDIFGVNSENLRQSLEKVSLCYLMNTLARVSLQAVILLFM